MIFVHPLLVLRVPALLCGADDGGALNGPLISSTPSLEKTHAGTHESGSLGEV